MTLLRRLLSWLTRLTPSRRPPAVSASWLQQHAYREGQRGVDLPRWRLPRERGTL